MIQTITVKNFKIFKNQTTFPLSKLNLLTGINGTGKSTVLQTMLLMQQSIQDNITFKNIVLNGNSINLGSFNDLRNHSSFHREPIVLSYGIQNGASVLQTIDLTLIQDEEDEMIAKMAPFKQKDFVSCFERIHYIAADRNGPQEFYFKSTLPSFLTVGKKGEYVANILLQKKTYTEIDDSLILPQKDPDLGTQVGVWLSHILDTDNVIVEVSYLGARIIVLNFILGNHLNNKLKPENVGFGYSYILPIVVAGLIAKPGEILIVENPEAHLHPKAQNRLTKFLARVAACGVQVFVESHSEHILNGLRIATLQDDINIQHDEVNVLYFQDDAKQPFVQLPILKNGKIADWPDGFFDQQEQDLANLFKLGRNKK